jgi:hypothetical protein
MARGSSRRAGQPPALRARPGSSACSTPARRAPGGHARIASHEPRAAGAIVFDPRARWPAGTRTAPRTWAVLWPSPTGCAIGSPRPCWCTTPQGRHQGGRVVRLRARGRRQSATLLIEATRPGTATVEWSRDGSWSAAMGSGSACIELALTATATRRRPASGTERRSRGSRSANAARRGLDALTEAIGEYGEIMPGTFDHPGRASRPSPRPVARLLGPGL